MLAVDRAMELLKNLSLTIVALTIAVWLPICTDQEMGKNTLDYSHGYQITAFKN